MKRKTFKGATKSQADYIINPFSIGFDAMRYEVRRAVRENGENVGSQSLGTFDTHAEADAAISADVAAGNKPADFVYGAK